ncbi:ribonuclease H-like domain-containing protein [Tanacetum coccineum]
MTDLGSLNYFLGVSAQRSKSGLFLSQSKFAKEILERAHMQHCNPCKTPVDTESKLGSDGDPVNDPTLYRSLAVRGTIDRRTSALSPHTSSQLTAYKDTDWLVPFSRKIEVLRMLLAETAWIPEYVAELHTPLFYCLHLSIVIKYVAFGQVRVLHVPSRFQYADIFTKGLPTALFLEFAPQPERTEDLPLDTRGILGLVWFLKLNGSLQPIKDDSLDV